SLHSLLLAMVLHPSFQEKVHAEIDDVVGSRRPPAFDDQPRMPYLHAVILETMRWNPVVPMGLPHTSLKDDVFDEYFIPKGTAVIGNGWGISRNTKYYEEPSKFDPERFLKQTPELDPREFVFGFGRRICPGSELGFQAIWITAASILWGFKLERGSDDIVAPEQDSERFSLGSVRYERSYKLYNEHNSLRRAKCAGVLQVQNYSKAPKPWRYVRSLWMIVVAKPGMRPPGIATNRWPIPLA
ncbi:hypothetical protein M407DRAFT_70263, partial [Tulasnella calospora MUT 4182]